MGSASISARKPRDGPRPFFNVPTTPVLPTCARDLKAPLVEAFGDQFAGGDLLKAEFRIRVDATPQADHFFLNSGDAGQNEVLNHR
jgi:hypothetical protein